MTFDELLSQVVDLLQRQGRVSYGALRRRFDLDEAYLEYLKDELIDAQQLAVDEGGKLLVWTGKGSLSSSVQSLGKAEAEEFLTTLLGEAVGATGRSPLHTLKQLILEKTEGTPFFMEEVVQELFEQGVLVRDGVETRHVASLPSDLRLPTTVQGVLAARIDRLDTAEKELLQQLAVIGREFPLSLVQQVVLGTRELEHREGV